MRQLARSPDRPMRVGQRGAAQKHQVDQLLPNDPVRHCRLTQIPADANGDPNLAPHPGAALHHERHVVERQVPCVIRVHAKAQIRQIQPMLLQRANGPDRFIELHAIGMEIVGAQPHRQRQPLRPDGAHGVQRLPMEPHPVFEGAAIVVVPLVGERREEAGAQVAMREMHFQPLEPGRQRTPGRVGIGAMNAVDLVHRQCLHRVGIAAAIGDGRRSPHLPSIGMVGCDLQLALPRLLLAALAPRMPKLNGWHGAHFLDDGRDTRQALDLAVIPDAGAARAGPAIWRDGDLLRKHEAKATRGAGPHQHDVVVAHAAID